jgi:hypothetical protein
LGYSVFAYNLLRRELLFEQTLVYFHAGSVIFFMPEMKANGLKRMPPTPQPQIE